MAKDNELNKIKDPIIKAERPIYYFITEEKLNDLINNDYMGSVLIVPFSIFLGLAISGWNIIYLVISLIFLLISIYFFIQKTKYIRSIKRSEKIELEQFKPAMIKKDKFKINRAAYGTPPGYIIDITDRLNKHIKNNKLVIIAGNDIAGGDPNKGTVKTLEIEYTYKNKRIKKVYREYELVNLPW